MFKRHENVWTCKESIGFYWRFWRGSSTEQFEQLIDIWLDGYVFVCCHHPRAQVVIDTSLWNVASTESLANLSTFLVSLSKEPDFWSKNKIQVKNSSLGSQKIVANNRDRNHNPGCWSKQCTSRVRNETYSHVTSSTKIFLIPPWCGLIYLFISKKKSIQIT